MTNIVKAECRDKLENSFSNLICRGESDIIHIAKAECRDKLENSFSNLICRGESYIIQI